MTGVARPGDDVRVGIVFAIIAVVVFSTGNVLIKWSTELYPVIEVAFFRNLFGTIPALIVMWHRGNGLADLRTRRPMGHILRSTIGLSAMMLVFTSFALLPLADAVAIHFAAPLFLTALSVPLLREQVGLHRWSAVVVGFIGVLIIVQPSGDTAELVSIGGLVALGAAFANALAMVQLRRLSQTEASTTIVLWFAGFSTVVTGVILPFYWVTPTLEGLAAMALAGLVAGTGQYLMTQGYHYAPAVTIAPFTYTTLIFAAILGYLVWGDVPAPTVYLGAGVVIASGIYIVYREHRRRVSVQKQGTDL